MIETVTKKGTYVPPTAKKTKKKPALEYQQAEIADIKASLATIYTTLKLVDVHLKDNSHFKRETVKVFNDLQDRVTNLEPLTISEIGDGIYE